MMKINIRICFLFILIFSEGTAQFGAPQLIDNDNSSGGNRYVTTADIDNNGFSDILVAKGYNYDQLAIYWNNGNMNFQEAVLDNLDDPVYIESGDINNNGFIDLIVITESSGELYLYQNNQGSFANPQLLDIENSFGKAMVIDDFNEDGNLDIVAIWQHAINLYLQETDGSFTKSSILTTSTSPNILECWTIDKGDINNDGHIDIITGETLGGVVYENDGQANFTPNLVTPTSHTTLTALKVFYANNDNYLDIVSQRAGGAVSIYEHTTNGFNYNFESDLFTPTNNSIQQFFTLDFDGNGKEDLYTAYEGKPILHLQNTNLNFSNNLILHEDSTLFIDQITIEDLDNDGEVEFLWSAAGNTLAYQKKENLSLPTVKKSTPIIYPNPTTSREVYIDKAYKNFQQIAIYSFTGKKVYTGKIPKSSKSINLSFLPSGIYLVEMSSDHTNVQTKLIVR